MSAIIGLTLFGLLLVLDVLAVLGKTADSRDERYSVGRMLRR